MSIPAFAANGSLPPGIHKASWTEFQQRFGINDHRRMLLQGMHRILLILKRCNCRIVYLDGSFVTSKPLPGDYDGCWQADGVDLDELFQLAPELIIKNGRAIQKAKYKGELFSISEEFDDTGFLEFFQKDREGQPKGIVAINLGELT